MTQILPKKYSLKEINEISFNGFVCNISSDVIELISDLTNKVGSPSYIKTPIFNKRNNITNIKPNIKQQVPIKKKKFNITEVLNDDDWDLINSFEVTKIEKKSGIETEIVNIRSIINMITDNNYTEKERMLIENLDRIMEMYKEEEISNLIIFIIDVITENKFYSELYVKLYNILNKKYEIINHFLNNKLSNYLNYFDKIEITNKEDNYDEMCRINKMNDIQEAFSLFIVNSVKYDIIKREYIDELINELLKKLEFNLEKNENKTLIDKIIENLYILYKEVKEKYIYNDFIKKIIEKVKENKYKLLSNKSKSFFKLMDILEL